nr:hypothetical protein [Tanacetum cinerariifolium]
TKVSEEQKQSMEDTMLELVVICQEKEFLCIHDDVDDLIESALNSKLLLINSNSQRLDKKEQEVKNVAKQPFERGNRNIQSLQNFRVVHKTFTTFSNPIFDNDNLDFNDDESLPDEDVPAEEFKIYSNPLFDKDEINSDKLDPHYFNVESDFVESLLNRNTFTDFSSKFDFSGELAHVHPEIPKFDFDFEEEIRFIENLLYDNSSPRPPEEFNAEIADTIIESIPSLHILVQDGNSQREEIDIVTKTDDVLPLSVENDDDSSNDPLLEEADLFLSDNLIPPGIENENPLIPRPPPEPPDAETDAGEEIPVVMNDKDEYIVYSSFIFVMFDKVFSLLSAESEDTIFDPGI